MTTPSLISDINIEQIVAGMRGILQENAHEIELDLGGQKSGKLRIEFTLFLEQVKDTGGFKWVGEYMPITRRMTANGRLESKFQTALPLTP
jgi:hypothetical protein